MNKQYLEGYKNGLKEVLDLLEYRSSLLVSQNKKYKDEELVIDDKLQEFVRNRYYAVNSLMIDSIEKDELGRGRNNFL